MNQKDTVSTVTARSGFLARRAEWWFLLVFILLALGILAVAFINFQKYELQFRAEAHAQLSAIANLKAGELVQWRKERMGNASMLFRNSAFSDLTRRVLENPNDTSAQMQLQAWADKYQAYDQYDRIFLLNSRGQVRLSSPLGMQSVSASVSNAVQNVLRSNQVTFLDFYRSEMDQRIYLGILIPIYGEQSPPLPLGVFFLSIDPNAYLFPFIQQWPGPSETAETLIFRREENGVLFLNNLKFHADAALHLRIPLSDTRVPAVQAVLGLEGITEGIDYRGEPVLAVVRAIPDSPWFMVARRDKAEVFAPIRTRLKQIIFLVAILICTAGTSVGLIWRQQRVRFYRAQFEASLALQESEDRFSVLVQNLPTGVVVHASDSSVLFANKMASQILGLTVDQMQGKTAMDPAWCFLKDNDTPLPLEEYPVNRVLSSGESFTSLVVGVRQPGIDSIRWALCNAYPRRDARDQLFQVVVSFNDITELKKAETELLESRRKLHLLFESMTTGFALHKIIRDEAGKPCDYLFLQVNPAFETLTGLRAADVVGRRVLEVLPQIEPLWIERYGQVVTTGEPVTFENYAQVLDRHYQVTAYRPEAEHFAVLINDITERQVARETLRQYAQELQEKNTELERFLYTVSHDLKSPVVTVRTFLGYLEQDLAKADAARIGKDMRFMRGAADKMAQQLDEVLEMSRIGRIENAPVRVTFRELVDEAIAAAAGTIAARGVGMTVIDRDMPLVGDRLRLTEIWQNLIENAVKFMGDQTAPHVDIGWETRGEETVFFVCDNGIGIDPRFHGKIFGLFEKLDAKAEGTGMGLAIVQRIVTTLYRGRIWVESAGRGQGSRFYFTLPGAVGKATENGIQPPEIK